MRLLTPLLPHQESAVEKLQRIKVGALFMDMGTGKSRSAIEIVARRREKISRVLWFCPVSLKETIRYEIAKHTAGESTYVFDDRTTDTDLPAAFWLVIGIESMSTSRRVILAANRLVDSRAMVIVDESSYIKGHRAARTGWITRIAAKARYRLVLTGTPISQGVQDLYAQMRFLSPEILGYRSFYSFAHNHLEYSDKHPGLIVANHNTAYLAARIAPYVFQVTKEECLTLPPKLYETLYLEMTPEQRRLYEIAKMELLVDVDPDEWQSFTIFRLFTVLQQITCGFWNRYPSPWWRRREEKAAPELLTADHGRLDLLLSVVERLPANAKIVIWAKYRRCIEEIRDRLKEAGEDPAIFYGDIGERARERELQRFRSNARFLIATPSCGGHGLTLTDSHYAIFYTNGFKYSERIQAEDRNHRIGQNERVTYVDLVCRNSIDERIQSALSRKGSLVQEFRQKVDRVKDKRSKKQAIEEIVRDL